MSKSHKDQVTAGHPTDVMLADYLDNLLSPGKRRDVEAHVASCGECLGKMACAYKSVESFNKKKEKPVRKINLYLIFAIISFALSFAFPRHFIQLLVATLLLGAKWVADSRSTKMLVMIHEAWKNGGEREAAEVIKRFDSNIKSRL